MQLEAARAAPYLGAEIEILRIDPRSSSYADGRVEYAVQFRLRDNPNVEEVVIEAGGEVTNA